MDMKFIFSPTCSTWNKLNVHFHTPAISVTQESNKWIRTVAPIANGAKKILVVLAFITSTVATGCFSIISLPCRIYLSKKTLEKDLNLLTYEEKKELKIQIRNYIDSRVSSGKFQQIPEKEKGEYIQKIMSYYARSSQFYGPVAVAWTEYLMEKANASGKKLIFLARDGIVPYKMALELMKDAAYQKKYPNLIGEDKIQVAYLSRNVVNSSAKTEESKKTFQEYIKQLKIQDGDACIFVDIGFTGSMIDNIRKMLPNVTIEFEFLISHCEKAAGFIYAVDDPRRIEENKQFLQFPTIKSIRFFKAGGNLATHWLEDSHQGAGASPTKLVEVNGTIYPDTKIPKQKVYAAQKGSLDYLLRKWSQKAVINSYKKFSIGNIVKKDVIEKLDRLLDDIASTKLSLLISHK